MSKRREIHDAISRALEECGARITASYTTGSSHQRVDFVVDGNAGHFTFANSPGGIRWQQNAVAAARRAVRKYRAAQAT